MWAVTSVAVLALFNYIVLTRKSKSPKIPANKSRPWGTTAIAFGLGVLLLEIAMRYLHK